MAGEILLENGELVGIITVAEYVEWRQPEVAAALWRLLDRAMVWSWLDRAMILSLSFAQWRAIMTEPPLAGKAGLLEGEKAV